MVEVSMIGRSIMEIHAKFNSVHRILSILDKKGIEYNEELDLMATLRHAKQKSIRANVIKHLGWLYLKFRHQIYANVS